VLYVLQLGYLYRLELMRLAQSKDVNLGHKTTRRATSNNRFHPLNQSTDTRFHCSYIGI